MTKKFNINDLSSMIHQTEITLHNGKKVKVRSLLNKEYKLLLMASESNTNINETIVQVLSNCVLTDGIDLELLPIFDLERLFIKVWQLSKGTSLIPVSYQCKNEVTTTDEEGNTVTGICGTEITVHVNLNTIQTTQPSPPEIKVNDNVTIIMRHPSLAEMEFYDFENEQVDVFNLLMRCVHSVQIQDDLFVVGDNMEYADVVELVDHMNLDVTERMTEFVVGTPHVYCEFPVRCPECGHTEPARLEGLDDFFA